MHEPTLLQGGILGFIGIVWLLFLIAVVLIPVALFSIARWLKQLVRLHESEQSGPASQLADSRTQD